MKLSRIVSGGQTGIDRAGLDAALELGIPCDGWCPKGRRAEDGAIPDIYPLQETASRDYRQRTRMNVIDSDGTLILTEGEPSGGTALTAEIARQKSKPILLVDLRLSLSPEEVAKWMDDNDIATLNVAGPRESECPGIYAKGRAFMLRIFGSKGF